MTSRLTLPGGTSRRRWDAALILAALAVAAGAVLGVTALSDTDAEVPDFALAGESALVWAVGDAADGGEDARSVAALMADDPPDVLLYLGDVYETGSLEEFESHYEPLFGRLAEVTAPTPGNHEWPTAGDGYFPYWEGAADLDLPPWYAFDVAGWEVLSLNSETEHYPGSPQVEWLKEQVVEPGTCRLAFWHAPRYSAGETHGDDPALEPLWDTLRGRAAIVVNGHEHGMQRFKPVGGITELVSGAGGHGLTDVEEGDPRLAFSEDEEYGALRLELEPGAARYAFVTVEGRTLDSGRISCQP